MEFWLHGFAIPGRVSELAARAEAWGFTGLLLADSQNLTADVWIELCLAAAATSRLRVGPGVSNPQTRHPAVTAAAAATLQRESGGRVSLGIGQGDSALSQIGLRARPVDEFEASLRVLQGLLRGEDVVLPGVAASRIHWLQGDTKVPLHVAATGRRTIAAGARQGDGVDLTVGADLGRLSGGVAIAREAAPRAIELGTYLNVAVDSDVARARELVRGSVATFARFSGGDTAAEYEPARHGEAGAGLAQGLSDDFIDRFAIVGDARRVSARLREVAACGIDRVIVVPGSVDSDPEAVARSCERLSREVIAGSTATAPRDRAGTASPAG